MRAVKYSNLTEQNHRDPTTFSLTDLRTELDEQRFNITPLNIAAHRTGENNLQGFLVLPFHIEMVSHISTTSRDPGPETRPQE